MKRKKLYIVCVIIVILVIGWFNWNFRWYARIGFSSAKWTDSISIDGMNYYIERVNSVKKQVDASMIDEPYTKILFKLSGNVRNSSYKMRSQDATYLEKGTIIYSIKEDARIQLDGGIGELVAAKVGDRYYLYRKAYLK